MPIPAFDHNLVLPPHLGNPASSSAMVSPFRATTVELVNRFATSPDRIRILTGLLNFREKLYNLGLHNGFQWVDGSFVEDIERQEGRAPRDIDIVTMYWCDPALETSIISALPEFRDRRQAKANFYLDHFAVNTVIHPEITIEHTRYWVQLFSHNRNQIWKGMVRVELNTPTDDAAALQILQKLPTS